MTEELKKDIVERDLKKGLELASRHLSEDTIKGLVDDFFSNDP